MDATQSSQSASSSTTWKLDATPPSVNGTLTGTAGSNGWYLGSVTYNGSTSDSLSGLASLTCSLDGSPLSNCGTATITDEGTHTFSFTAQDNAGNMQTFDQTVSIDTQNPNLTTSISGTLGSNGWYNEATLNASASDPGIGSGLSALEYNLDNGGWVAFPVSGSFDLAEGVHNIEVRAVDAAGRVTSSTKSYSLDTTLPTVAINPSGTLGNNNWYTSNLSLSASADDSTSGIDLLEYSLNNGAWTTYTSSLTLSDGTHTISFWAQDISGLVTQVDASYNVDTHGPQIIIPDSWFQWDTVTLDAWDSDSGLESVRIEISDPDGRWPTRKIDLDPNDFPLDFQWDRRFKDGTVAPLGSYKFKIFATDKMGHTTQRHASIKILLGILPDAAPIPFGDTQGEPADLSVVPAPTVETSPQSIPPAPRAAPTKTTVSERIESIFAPSSTEVTTTDVASETDTSAFEYATYAAMLAAVTAYTLAEKKRKEEEERRRAEAAARKREEPQMTRQEQKRAKQRKELQKIWDANGAAIYEANQAFKSAHGKEMDAGTKDKAIKDATVNGVFHAGGYASNLVIAKAEEDARLRAEQEQAAKATGSGKPLYSIDAQANNGNRDEEGWVQWMLGEKGYPLPQTSNQLPIVPSNGATDYDIYTPKETVMWISNNTGLIKRIASDHNIPPELLATVIASEIDFDTSQTDIKENQTVRQNGSGFRGLTPTLGRSLGIGQVRYATWAVAAHYYKDQKYVIPTAYQGLLDKLDSGVGQQEFEVIVLGDLLDNSLSKIDPNQFSADAYLNKIDHTNGVDAAAMVTRLLAEYRMGNGGVPNSDITGLDSSDTAIIYTAYRAGVNGLTCDGRDCGFPSIEDFQNWSKDPDNTVYGWGDNPKKALAYAEYFFNKFFP